MDRNFKGIWIPKEIWLAEDLTMQEKVMLVEIDSLDDEERGCYASNKYFCKFFNISSGRVSQIIQALVSKKYITVTYIKENEAIKERQIRINRPPYPEVFNNLNTYLENLNKGIKYSKEGYLENYKENNTSINNTSINKYIGDKETNDLFLDFLEMRKKKKIPNTDRAIKLLLNKLKDLSIEEQKKVLEESIVKGWTSIYPQKSNMPEWSKKEIKKETIDEKEQQELEEMLKEFRK